MRAARVIAVLGLWVFVGCSREQTVVAPATPTAALRAAAAPVATERPREDLPRAVGGVTLRMPRPGVEAQLGALDCHPNPDGFDVCRPKDGKRGETGLEVYLYHDEVVALAYEVAVPADVGSHLEGLSKRYGVPSLNGLTEHDRTGRLHEIYGWRDDDSLYSIRFVYQETENQPRRLAGATVTLWDRAAYSAWEKDAARRKAAPRSAT